MASIFTGQTFSWGTDGTAYNLATRFSSSSDGQITGMRMYVGGTQLNGTSVTLSLYTDSGTLLGSVSPTLSTSTGWLTFNLSSAVSITAGTVYRATLWTPGYFGICSGLFASSDLVNSPLTAPVSGGNGWVYANASAAPTNGGAASGAGNAYGIDVVWAAPSLSKLVCTATKTDSTHTSISWSLPDATITNGVTILRASGDKTATTDGAGKTSSDSGYDPTTIAGTTVVATGLTTSPYADTVPSAGTYTYWIARTAG